MVEKKISDIDYLVKTPGRCKEKCLCHIDMLKLYQERQLDHASVSCSVVCSVATEVDEDVSRGPKLTNSVILHNLQRKLSMQLRNKMTWRIYC